MGFLDQGSTLSWPQTKAVADYIREHGIKQFLNTWRRLKERKNDTLLWGDEVEFLLVRLDDTNKKVQLALRAPEIREALTKKESEGDGKPVGVWLPEYGQFMVETTPPRPYTANLDLLCIVENNMRERRRFVESVLKENERIVSMSVFPLMGVDKFTYPEYEPRGPIAQSEFTPDELINSHVRFGTLTQNIRQRRGANVAINVPVFHDTNTGHFRHNATPWQADDYQFKGENPAQPDSIYMDSMAFGMGNCCLQCTFQCCSIDEARQIYDQFAVLCPIMTAVAAASPIYRGMLADIDVRWNVISGSVDDRTPQELGRVPCDESCQRIPKSRYASASLFISAERDLEEEYNDYDIVYNHDVYNELVRNGVDNLLALHVSHLFIRDPLVIYEGKVEIDDETHVDHFENIQSTNWQTVRFKPPPPDKPIGWRVEFRPMDVSLTDFENAAFSVFIVLMVRVITIMDVDFYIPISKVDENLQNALKRDAVNEGKFYWRKNARRDQSKDYELMSVNEIINGQGDDKSDGFPGLVPMINVYLDTTPIRAETRSQLDRYLTLVSKRASGELVTPATWMRNFVRGHPAYKFDSVVSDEIAYDLVKACDRVAQGEWPREMFGDLYGDTPCSCVVSDSCNDAPTATPKL